MKILSLFKNLINKVDEIDKKSKEMSKEKYYSSNPFAFKENRTYVWIDKVRNDNNCND